MFRRKQLSGFLIGGARGLVIEALVVVAVTVFALIIGLAAVWLS